MTPIKGVMLLVSAILIVLGIASMGDAAGESTYGPVVGIDLGTTNTRVGIHMNRQVEITTNDQGNRFTPSYVAFNKDGEHLVGDAAKNQFASNPTSTVFGVKRLIGRKFNDNEVQSDIKNFPF
ncbi:78 kDa glucose-regulated protein, partial [Actinomortierella ambigua]